jgi:hypothetical protein
MARRKKDWDDDSALDFLCSRHFVVDSTFHIVPPLHLRTCADLTWDESDAIDYLCDEWDYGFQGVPVKQ